MEFHGNHFGGPDFEQQKEKVWTVCKLLFFPISIIPRVGKELKKKNPLDDLELEMLSYCTLLLAWSKAMALLNVTHDFS